MVGTINPCPPYGASFLAGFRSGPGLAHATNSIVSGKGDRRSRRVDRKQKPPFPGYGGKGVFARRTGRRRPTLPRNHSRSTIGAEELNDRVRDGNGCDLLARATAPKGISFSGSLLNRGFASNVPASDQLPFLERMVKPHGLLVSVSSRHYCPYTPDLSTSWSTRGLQSGCPEGNSHLGVGFPLRCFQRLSLPNIATQRCHWRDNWDTRGSSIPVLSY